MPSPGTGITVSRIETRLSRELTLGQKVAIAALAGAVVGAIGVIVTHHLTKRFSK